MKAKILDINGKKVKDIELPKCFNVNIRDDIVSKVLETKKLKQPYAPNVAAGKQHSASGKIRHRRRKWRTSYGYGISRIPRKILSTKGSRFNWIGAEISSTRGGRRSHPPKILSMIKRKKINKKEEKLALCSALTATTKPEIIKKKYSTLQNKEIKNIPIIIDIKDKVKTKQLTNVLRKILGENYSVTLKKKTIRAGRGKMRGRRYKKSAGLLFVVGKNEKIKTKIFDIIPANKVSVVDLAKGGIGRLTVYTPQAIKELEERTADKKNKSENKEGKTIK